MDNNPYPESLCFYPNGVDEGDVYTFEVDEDKGCINNYTIYKYSMETIDYYLYFDNSGYWMISDDIMSTDIDYLCAKRNLLNCTAGDWAKWTGEDQDMSLSFDNNATIEACSSESTVNHKSIELAEIELISIILGLMLIIFCTVLFIYYRVKRVNKSVMKHETSVQYGTLENK